MKQGWRYNVLKETVVYITKYEGILAEGNDPLSFFLFVSFPFLWFDWENQNFQLYNTYHDGRRKDRYLPYTGLAVHGLLSARSHRWMEPRHWEVLRYTWIPQWNSTGNRSLSKPMVNTKKCNKKLLPCTHRHVEFNKRNWTMGYL